MSTTTFSGPVKAGSIFNTTGTTLSKNVSNQGQATMVQVQEIGEVGPGGTDAVGDEVWTDIVIPAKSQITRIAVLVTNVFNNGGVSDRGIVHIGHGVDGDRNSYVSAIDLETAGLKEADIPAEIGDETKWRNVGDTDSHISYSVNGTSESVTGKGILIIEYSQARDITV